MEVDDGYQSQMIWKGHAPVDPCSRVEVIPGPMKPCYKLLKAQSSYVNLRRGIDGSYFILTLREILSKLLHSSP